MLKIKLIKASNIHNFATRFINGLKTLKNVKNESKKD